MSRAPQRCWSWGAVALGAILWLIAYPPFHLVLPSFIALVPYVVFLERAAARASIREAATGGAMFGLASAVLLFHWVPVALWLFTPWALLLSAGLLAVMAAGWAAVAAATILLWRSFPALPRWLVFAVGWTSLEALLALPGPMSFPWLGLAASLSEVTLLLQGADLAGSLLLTLWLAAVNAAVGRAVMGAASRWRTAGAVALSLAVAVGYGAFRIASVPMERVGRVLLVQPNVPASADWYAAGDSIVEALIDQTRRATAEQPADLIIWPEVAAPGFFRERPDWRDLVAGLAANARAPILLGALDRSAAGGVYNAAFSWPTGPPSDGIVVYHKRRLVPVTERPILGLSVSAPGRESGARFAPGGDALPIESPVGPLGVTVCFESIFPDLARDYRRMGAAVLVNLTNDVWMGRTGGPWQHAAHLRLRAVETRMGVVQAANSGVSLVVDPLGRVVGGVPPSVRAARAVDVLASPSIPPAVFLGRWPGSLCLGATAVLVLLAFATRRSGRF